MGHRIDPSWGGPIELFFVPCYPICGMVHIKEPLLLIDKSSLCGSSGFPFSLSEWSLTICLTPYNRRYNVLSASLNKTFLSLSWLYDIRDDNRKCDTITAWVTFSNYQQGILYTNNIIDSTYHIFCYTSCWTLAELRKWLSGSTMSGYLQLPPPPPPWSAFNPFSIL